MREYIGDHIRIDGRMIAYRLVTNQDYFSAKGFSEDEIENLPLSVYRTVNRIMALKQSCWLLRRTGHSCGSLSESLYDLKEELIQKLQEEDGFEFDDDFVERNGQPQKYCKVCGEEMIVCYDGQSRHGTYDIWNMTADGNHDAVER